MFLRKKKSQLNSCSAIIGLNATQDVSFSSSCSFLVPIVRAVLALLLTLGSICGFASCFGAEFDTTTVFLILLAGTSILAYCRNLRSTILKNIFYITFFFAYAYAILHFYTYVNSGYHAIVNLTYAALENYLQIPALVYYEEIIENSYTTITFFLIFWGIFELFLYHMWITNHIHFLSIFIVSISPLAIPFFTNQRPDNIYIFFLIWAYFGCIILQHSNHTISEPKKKQSFWILKKYNHLTMSHPGFAYSTNGLTYFASLAYAFILSLMVFLLVSVVIPYPTYQKTSHESELKESVKDDVKYFVTFGLSGYFNQYRAIGGMSDGRLGGIQSVRPDFQTDLIVRMVPTNYDTIYLRGYVGIGYTNRKWLSTLELVNQHILSERYQQTFMDDIMLVNEYEQLDYGFISPNLMKVTNVDAGIQYPYSPYYTNPNEISDMSCFTPDNGHNFYHSTRDYHFYSSNFWNSLRITSDSDVQTPSTEVLSACLQVPDETRSEIIRFLITHDLCVNYVVFPGTYSALSGDALARVISKLSDCLTNDFVYSLNPGLTPRNADFVGYFLNDSQKGYCAHFATAAALILRTLGIPTRYVEGYVVTYDDLIEATIVEEESARDYVDTSVVDMPLRVMDIEIGDDKAHAWLEYFDPDFGWRVFEATTASSEQFGSPDFWNSLYGFLSQTTQTDSNITINAKTSGPSILEVIARIAIGLFVLLLVALLGFYSYRFTRQYRSYHRNRDNINVRNLYKLIATHIQKKHPNFAYLVTFKEQLDFINTHYQLNKAITPSVLSKLCKILEQAAFSRDQLTSTEAIFAMKTLHLMRKNILFGFIKKRPQ